MNLSAVFIRRPVATILLALAVTVGGLFAYFGLPVAALPSVDFPTITVSAQLAGASPDTMANSVATPLVKQFSTIPSIQTISASSTQGSTQITIQFDLDRDIDQAAADVQAAIARTQRSLPAEMTTQPSYRKLNPADAPVLLLTLQSRDTPLSKLDAFAQDVISPALSTISGVGQVSIYGSQKYAVRIEIDPGRLAARGIGIDQLAQAISDANSDAPVGTVAGPGQQLAIEADTQMVDAAAFRDLIVATVDGRSVRLGDVARVIDSVENTQSASWYDGDRSLVLAVQRQPDANTVAVVDAVKAMLPQFTGTLGPSASIHVLNDRSTSIRAAVDDVQLTLGLTVALVFLVILLFLRRLPATLIPTVAVPISIIGTCAAMQALGFSIDNISLLGLTLSVGLVVDDAIVMLENIVRHVEEGMAPFEAALQGSREIGFTILSISVSLVAVFIPVLLMGGVVGRIFHEFAVVVTVAILVSAFVSLTLTPMLCARLPASDPDDARRKPGLAERGFEAVLGGYRRALDVCLGAKPIVFVVFLGTIVLTVLMFQAIPKGFIPQEDIGQLSVSTEARQDISYDAMTALQAQVETVLAGRPYVAHLASVVGASGPGGNLNSGRFFVELLPKDQRMPLAGILADLRQRLGAIPGIASYVVPVQNLNIGGRASKSQYQFVVQSVDQGSLYDWSTRLAGAMAGDPSFADVTTDLQNGAIQATIVVDRDKANALGISASDLRSTLYAGFGTRQVSTIYATGDSYEVIAELDPEIPWTSDSLGTIKVRSSAGALVPLSSFAHVERTAGLLSVNQLGQLPAVTVSFNLPAGVSLGQAVDRIDVLKATLGVPPSISTTFSGTAQIFQDALGNQGMLLLGAILTIYVVLGILYESFIHPLTILTGLPAAAVGALGALTLFGMDLSVIAIIGILMLIGIVKKNAIMMIDVALALQRAGKTPHEAIREACLLRFRPIMMTTLAAIAGTLPIAIGAGASAELRQPLGVAVVGGLLVSQALTLFTTPVLFLYMEGLSRGTRRLIARWRAAGPAPNAPAPGE